MAELIATWEPGTVYQSDFNYIREDLFKDEEGYFVEGRGGAASIYGEVDGSGARCWGEKSFRLTEEEAEAFVQAVRYWENGEIFAWEWLEMTLPSIAYKRRWEGMFRNVGR